MYYEFGPNVRLMVYLFQFLQLAVVLKLPASGASLFTIQETRFPMVYTIIVVLLVLFVIGELR